MNKIIISHLNFNETIFFYHLCLKNSFIHESFNYVNKICWLKDMMVIIIDKYESHNSLVKLYIMKIRVVKVYEVFNKGTSRDYCGDNFEGKPIQ